MGFNTSVLILNDGLHEIEKDLPAWWGRMRRAIPGYGSADMQVISAGSFANPSTVIESHHADYTSVIAVGGNYATVLGIVLTSKHSDEKAQLSILKDLAAQRGYRLVKKGKA